MKEEHMRLKRGLTALKEGLRNREEKILKRRAYEWVERWEKDRSEAWQGNEGNLVASEHAEQNDESEVSGPRPIRLAAAVPSEPMSGPRLIRIAAVVSSELKSRATLTFWAYENHYYRFDKNCYRWPFEDQAAYELCTGRRQQSCSSTMLEFSLSSI